MKTKIYPAGREGEYILEWQTEAMQGPAFNYFKTETEARQAGMLAEIVIGKLRREAPEG